MAALCPIICGIQSRPRRSIEELDQQLAAAQQELGQSSNFAAQLESNIKFLNERVEKSGQELAVAKRALYCHVADAIGRESEERILRECSMCESAAAMQLAREKEVR
jgi:hypothetical protein